MAEDIAIELDLGVINKGIGNAGTKDLGIIRQQQDINTIASIMKSHVKPVMTLLLQKLVAGGGILGGILGKPLPIPKVPLPLGKVGVGIAAAGVGAFLGNELYESFGDKFVKGIVTFLTKPKSKRILREEISISAEDIKSGIPLIKSREELDILGFSIEDYNDLAAEAGFTTATFGDEVRVFTSNIEDMGDSAESVVNAIEMWTTAEEQLNAVSTTTNIITKDGITIHNDSADAKNREAEATRNLYDAQKDLNETLRERDERFGGITTLGGEGLTLEREGLVTTEVEFSSGFQRRMQELGLS